MVPDICGNRERIRLATPDACSPEGATRGIAIVGIRFSVFGAARKSFLQYSVPHGKTISSPEMITMRKQLAIDAGGTTTRAVVLDSRGHALGYGRAGSGNPTASGIDDAAAAVLTAAQRALRSDATPTDSTSSVLIALAGFESERFRRAVTDLIAGVGFRGGVAIESDLAGMFFSGTYRADGYGLIAGTGAVAARIERGELVRVAGGAGWLLGDSGSGFWIGHRVARGGRGAGRSGTADGTDRAVAPGTRTRHAADRRLRVRTAGDTGSAAHPGRTDRHAVRAAACPARTLRALRIPRKDGCGRSGHLDRRGIRARRLARHGARSTTPGRARRRRQRSGGRAARCTRALRAATGRSRPGCAHTECAGRTRRRRGAGTAAGGDHG
ncbi:MAG: hypothetical protein EPN48_08225 [Microbacteriaceae bacterium]|nr:MAG: hypothetical protein EPN48_08225 [Microbacteriaceae bacterium]